MGKQTEAVLQEHFLILWETMLSGLLKITKTIYFALAKKLKEQENKATTPLLAKPNSN